MGKNTEEIGNMMLGSGMGLASSMIGNYMQLGQQSALNQQAMNNAKELTKYNTEQQMQMWRDTNYSAQIEQMKKAGISPGLMYGKGGAGGAMMDVKPGTYAPPQAQDKTMALLNSALMGAQIKNIEADTKQKEANATKTAGVDTANTEMQTASLAQGIENAKAQKTLIEADKYLKDIEGYITSSTSDDKIGEIKWNAQKAYELLMQSKNETYISDQTLNDKVQIINENAQGAVLQNILTQANIKKTAQEIKNMITQINQKNTELANEGKRLDIQQQQVIINGVLGAAGIATGAVQAGKIAEAMNKTTVTSTYTTNPDGTETHQTKETYKR